MKRFSSVAPLLVLTLACGPGGEGSGSRLVIQNKGSDTLVNVAQAWAERYGELHSDVAVAVSGGGSGTGISSIINGTVDIANSSRQMHAEEIESAEANGIEPVEFVVGHDALAVFLHPDNPIQSFTLAQLADIYGEEGSIETWSQFGVTVPGCSSDEIVRVSRQNNSGTYAYFQEAVLGEAEYRLGSRDLHGSKDVVDLVENTPCAIGYSGLAYTTDHVKMPCIMKEDGAPCVEPTIENAMSGAYPISRPLLMYTRGVPEGAVKAYMDWVLSDEGQCILVDKGYAPARALTCPAA
ncbi:MAG TPA: PstS family phosphate ABC transporter substrate-binding protein [Longimicrobiales bacterium]|nr:PstS family phosphate ABC transporter substrate-binding protein [Longimicrobiales bacterium]